MNKAELETLVKIVVDEARRLKDCYTDELYAPVNYCAIFSENILEFNSLRDAARQIGAVIDETEMGPVFRISPIETDAGALRILKIRLPDKTRKERGDADFTVSDYGKFKAAYLGMEGFDCIVRKDREMMELVMPKFKARAYFSHPTPEELYKA